MRTALLGLIVWAGCGRVRFTPLDEAGGGDASTQGDGDGGGDGAPGPDAPPTACDTTTGVAVGMTTVNTCATGLDLIDGCGPAATQEIVLRWTVPSTGSYTIQARDAGTANVSNSTSIANATCSAIGTCNGILGNSFTAGQVIYFVIEASSGTCADIDFLIQ